MHTHKLARPQTYAARLEAFAKASEWHVNVGMVKAKSLYAVAKARQLHTLQTQPAPRHASLRAQKHRELHLGQDLFDTLRERGKSHYQALRCLGQRWIKIIWKMWQTRTTYNAELNLKNQTTHGSWVLKITPA